MEDKRNLEQILLPLPMEPTMHPPKRAVKLTLLTSALKLPHLAGSQAALRQHLDKQTATRTDSHTQATGQTASKP